MVESAQHDRPPLEIVPSPHPLRSNPQEVVGTPAAEGAGSYAPVPSSNPLMLPLLQRVERIALHVEACRLSLRRTSFGRFSHRVARFARALDLQYEARMAVVIRAIEGGQR